MEGILSIIQSLTKVNRSQLPTVIKTLDEHQAFNQKASTELNGSVQHINELLGNRQTKHEGLLLLSTFLSQCPLDLLEQKGTFWITQCTKICAQRNPLDSVDLSYRVLGELLKKSVNTPDLCKSIGNSLLPKMIETITVAPPTAFFAALKFLEMAMITYPGQCGTSKATIEKFTVTFVDSLDERLVKQSAKCLQLLQQIRSGGAHGINHKQSWAQLQSQLIGSLHEYLSLMFSNTVEVVDSATTDTDRLTMPEMELSDDPMTRSMQLQIRFVNLCKYLRTILIEPFPVAKAIQPTKILSLISRGLAVNCATLSKNLITDNIIVGTLLPRIHVALLNLLESLILVLRSHMLLYGRGVCQLVNQSLKWTSSGTPNGFKKLFITIRKATYHTLDIWCKTASYGSGVETIADDLIEQILQDITPYQNEVTLKVLVGGNKHVSKKAHQKMLKQQSEATNLAQTHSNYTPNTKLLQSDEGNEQLCASALRCLINILSSTGCFLKPATHKILQENIVAFSMSAIESTAPPKSHLYSSPDCRLQLYSALHSLIVSSHYLCPPPIQYAATIFNIAKINDANPKVRDVCTDFMRSIEKILHPQMQCLYYPTEFDDIRTAIAKDIVTPMTIAQDSDDEEIIVDGKRDMSRAKDTGVSNTELNESYVSINENDSIVSSPTNNLIEKEITKSPDSSDDSIVEVIELSQSSTHSTDSNNIEMLEKPATVRHSENGAKRILPPMEKEEEIDVDVDVSVVKKRKQVKEDTLKDDEVKTDVDIVEELASSFVDELTENIL